MTNYLTLLKQRDKQEQHLTPLIKQLQYATNPINTPLDLSKAAIKEENNQLRI